MGKLFHGPRLRHNNRLRRGVCALATLGVCAAPRPALAAQEFELEGGQSFSAGLGFRSQFESVDNESDFSISSMRLYTSGELHDKVKFTFNLQQIAGESGEVLDAIAQFEFAPQFNIWAGRMLTPADRIEMNGPYYALSWNQYRQPLYPSDQGGEAGRFGRDEGVTLWGAAGKFQYAVGAFRGLEDLSNQSDERLFAARFAYNFLNMESNPGYYTSSTYFGEFGNILTAALSFQNQADGTGSAENPGDFSGYTFDVLSETLLGGGGVMTVEAEYKSYDADFTLATTPPAGDCFCLFDGDSAFVTAAYLFPDAVGPGRLQPYLRQVENSPSDAASSSSTELGLNYIVNGHDARFNLNFVSGDANASGYAGDDVDTLSLGLQIQL